jgi:predicted RNase H-like HicB family nuclease
MKALTIKHHTIIVYLDEDGYTAYYKEFPYISAGGKTEEEALRELAVAFELACENNGNSNKKNIYDLKTEFACYS